MNWQTIGAIMENYDVAQLAGHNVMHYSDCLKGDNVHKSFESHSKDFNSVILIFLVLFEHDFLKNLRDLTSQKNGNKNVQYLFVLLSRVFSLTGSHE